MLEWPKRARAALVFLFRPLQDIDVYVEDSGDEVFYSELFRRIAPYGVKIVRVFCAGGRAAVVDRARNHDFASRLALFVIDGDFEWVRGEPSPGFRGVHRLDAYCVENLLIHERAAVELVIEEGAKSQDEAHSLFNFAAWIRDVSSSLVELFVWFAVLNRVDPTQLTTGLGIGATLSAGSKGASPELDTGKVEALRCLVEAKCTAAGGSDVTKEIYDVVRARVGAMHRPFDVISGKDFLMPLFDFRLWACIPGKTRRRSLRIRLARHCEPSLFTPLATALEEASHSISART